MRGRRRRKDRRGGCAGSRSGLWSIISKCRNQDGRKNGTATAYLCYGMIDDRRRLRDDRRSYLDGRPIHCRRFDGGGSRRYGGGRGWCGGGLHIYLSTHMGLATHMKKIDHQKIGRPGGFENEMVQRLTENDVLVG